MVQVNGMHLHIPSIPRATQVDRVVARMRQMLRAPPPTHTHTHLFCREVCVLVRLVSAIVFFFFSGNSAISRYFA